jgi:DNA-directed RNA polymerase sigma subunit (sigma70/sigma32)
MEQNEKRRCGYGVTHTLEETAELMGITRERVRQIEKQALEKLRRRLKLRYGITSLAGIL